MLAFVWSGFRRKKAVLWTQLAIIALSVAYENFPSSRPGVCAGRGGGLWTGVTFWLESVLGVFEATRYFYRVGVFFLALEQCELSIDVCFDFRIFSPLTRIWEHSRGFHTEWIFFPDWEKSALSIDVCFSCHDFRLFPTLTSHLKHFRAALRPHFLNSILVIFFSTDCPKKKWG